MAEAVIHDMRTVRDAIGDINGDVLQLRIIHVVGLGSLSVTSRRRRSRGTVDPIRCG